jgi:hypothetical protein
LADESGRARKRDERFVSSRGNHRVLARLRDPCASTGSLSIRAGVPAEAPEGAKAGGAKGSRILDLLNAILIFPISHSCALRTIRDVTFSDYLLLTLSSDTSLSTASPPLRCLGSSKDRFSDVGLRNISAPERGQVDYWDEKLPACGLRVSRAQARSTEMTELANGLARQWRPISRAREGPISGSCRSLS